MSYSVEYMIAHASHRTAALSQELDAFIRSDFWSQLSECDGERVRIYLSVDRQIPDPLHGVFFDAVMALRAALDHLAYAFCESTNHAGMTAVQLETLYFPIGDTYEKVLARTKSSKLHPDFSDVILNAKPYQGGNSDIWALHTLANRQKHRVLQLMLCGVESLHLQGNMGTKQAGDGSRPGRVQFPADLSLGRSLVADLPNRPGVSASIEFTPYVGVFLPGELPARSVVEFLVKVRHDVDEIYARTVELAQRLQLI